jgi:hypothetical protein
VDAFLDWQALEFAPDLVAFGTFASNTTAALVAGNLPSLTGKELDAVRVNAAGDGVEFADVTAAGWALLDDADAAAQRVTLGVKAIDAPGTAPLYACRAWVSFNGTGTVAIIGSGNVSSVVDTLVGGYVVNFTTDMTDANYCSVGTSDESFGGSGGQVVCQESNSGYATFITSDSDGTRRDNDRVSVAIFR